MNMAHNFPPQARFFYEGAWDEQKDDFCMSFIINDFERNESEKKSNIPIGTLRRVRRAAYQKFEHNFSWDEICDRYALLKKRYNIFKSLIGSPGVLWDKATNVVYANDVIWYSLCQRNELVKAYYNIGEKYFDKLVLIFEVEDDKEFSWQKLEVDDNDDAEEEVSSQMSNTNVRRQLFNVLGRFKGHLPIARTARKPMFG